MHDKLLNYGTKRLQTYTNYVALTQECLRWLNLPVLLVFTILHFTSVLDYVFRLYNGSHDRSLNRLAVKSRQLTCKTIWRMACRFCCSANEEVLAWFPTTATWQSESNHHCCITVFQCTLQKLKWPRGINLVMSNTTSATGVFSYSLTS